MHRFLLSIGLYLSDLCVITAIHGSSEITRHRIFVLYIIIAFLPRDASATQSSVMRQYDVCLSDRLSVTFRYHDHTGWNTSKTISRPNSLRNLLRLTPTCAIWCNGNTPKIWVK